MLPLVATGLPPITTRVLARSISGRERSARPRGPRRQPQRTQRWGYRHRGQGPPCQRSVIGAQGWHQDQRYSLVEGDHNIDCKIEGFGGMKLKSEFVKKASATSIERSEVHRAAGLDLSGALAQATSRTIDLTQSGRAPVKS